MSIVVRALALWRCVMRQSCWFPGYRLGATCAAFISYAVGWCSAYIAGQAAGAFHRYAGFFAVLMPPLVCDRWVAIILRPWVVDFLDPVLAAHSGLWMGGSDVKARGSPERLFAKGWFSGMIWWMVAVDASRRRVLSGTRVSS